MAAPRTPENVPMVPSLIGVPSLAGEAGCCPGAGRPGPGAALLLAPGDVAPAAAAAAERDPPAGAAAAGVAPVVDPAALPAALMADAPGVVAVPVAAPPE